MPPLDELRAVGAIEAGEARWRFSLWAPLVDSIQLHLLGDDERRIEMVPAGDGYHEVTVEGVRHGDRYLFGLGGGRERPDPASRSQPDGVHAASEIVTGRFEWTDDEWHGLPLEDFVLYELHIGTFTPEGTFAGAIGRLDELAGLGVTAIEVMPIAQFPGGRNWGYDGVYPFAVQNSYGGLVAFKRFVDACHQRRLAVVLDVVYNHFGPEGSYVSEFGPFFTDRYKTPWGDAINFDGAGSDHVRNYFLQNARFWIEESHVDALRLDAVHAIFDQSAHPFLQDVAELVDELSVRLGRNVYAIAESDLNDPRLVRERDKGGFGLHGQWCDDLHHSVHAVLTGERNGYYRDFGRLEQIARALEEKFVYAGDHSVHRQRRHGAPALEIRHSRFVVSMQNHDQIGNRVAGDRLASRLSIEQQKLTAGLVILSPFIPLLFMGEEYGESAPFHYFTSHSDSGLIAAVRRGRREEFAAFSWAEESPDPQAVETFLASRVDPSRGEREPGRSLREFYARLIAFRKELRGLLLKDGPVTARVDEARLLEVWREGAGGDAYGFFYNLSEQNASLDAAKTARSTRIFASQHDGGRDAGHSLPPWSFAVHRREIPS
ncbi:MAG TPA: malto-oligosyltrehalose trehalohydrolase [Thermoanaerobaculia bacterium]|nr:malto-oligosyltrehalose trehalohydrolase [Thermoanaerobaculia bacterium]